MAASNLPAIRKEAAVRAARFPASGGITRPAMQPAVPTNQGLPPALSLAMGGAIRTNE
jgi:hypothetical protein